MNAKVRRDVKRAIYSEIDELDVFRQFVDEWYELLHGDDQRRSFVQYLKSVAEQGCYLDRCMAEKLLEDMRKELLA